MQIDDRQQLLWFDHAARDTTSGRRRLLGRLGGAMLALGAVAGYGVAAAMIIAALSPRPSAVVSKPNPSRPAQGPVQVAVQSPVVPPERHEHLKQDRLAILNKSRGQRPDVAVETALVSTNPVSPIPAATLMAAATRLSSPTRSNQAPGLMAVALNDRPAPGPAIQPSSRAGASTRRPSVLDHLTRVAQADEGPIARPDQESRRRLWSDASRSRGTIAAAAVSPVIAAGKPSRPITSWGDPVHAPASALVAADATVPGSTTRQDPSRPPTADARAAAPPGISVTGAMAPRPVTFGDAPRAPASGLVAMEPVATDARAERVPSASASTAWVRATPETPEIAPSRPVVRMDPAHAPATGLVVAAQADRERPTSTPRPSPPASIVSDRSIVEMPARVALSDAPWSEPRHSAASGLVVANAMQTPAPVMLAPITPATGSREPRPLAALLEASSDTGSPDRVAERPAVSGPRPDSRWTEPPRAPASGLVTADASGTPMPGAGESWPLPPGPPVSRTPGPASSVSQMTAVATTRWDRPGTKPVREPASGLVVADDIKTAARSSTAMAAVADRLPPRPDLSLREAHRSVPPPKEEALNQPSESSVPVDPGSSARAKPEQPGPSFASLEMPPQPAMASPPELPASPQGRPQIVVVRPLGASASSTRSVKALAATAGWTVVGVRYVSTPVPDLAFKAPAASDGVLALRNRLAAALRFPRGHASISVAPVGVAEVWVPLDLGSHESAQITPQPALPRSPSPLPASIPPLATNKGSSSVGTGLPALLRPTNGSGNL